MFVPVFSHAAPLVNRKQILLKNQSDTSAIRFRVWVWVRIRIRVRVPFIFLVQSEK